MSSFELTADGAGITARIGWTETVYPDENRSDITVTVELKSTAWYGVSYWLSGAVAGKTLDPAVHYAYLGSKGAYYPVEDTFTLSVPHQPDGTATAEIAVNIRGATRSGGADSGWRVQGSRTVELTPIVRASTVGATDSVIGGVSMVAVSRKNSTYSHSLHFSFGALSGYIKPDGTLWEQEVLFTETAIPFQIPQSFYGQIPNSPSGSCTLTCVTYDGQTPVGLPATAAFTVTAPKEHCAPLLTAQVTDTNPVTAALTGDSGVLVRYCSKAYCTAQAQGQKGAQIAACTVDGQPVPLEIEGVQQTAFLFQASDSRGYSSAVEVRLPMIPYVELTLHGTCRRPDATGSTAILSVQGSVYNGSFGASENTLTLTAQVGGRTYTLQPERTEDGYSATVELTGLDYGSAYNIVLVAADKIRTVESSVYLQRGVPVFDWGKRDFAFHVPITAPSINGIRNPALQAWPVGSVYMSVQEQSPAQLMGGKWEKLENIGIDLNLWRRLQGADLLGSAVLGSMTLGEEV